MAVGNLIRSRSAMGLGALETAALAPSRAAWLVPAVGTHRAVVPVAGAVPRAVRRSPACLGGWRLLAGRRFSQQAEGCPINMAAMKSLI